MKHIKNAVTWILSIFILLIALSLFPTSVPAGLLIMPVAVGCNPLFGKLLRKKGIKIKKAVSIPILCGLFIAGVMATPTKVREADIAAAGNFVPQAMVEPQSSSEPDGVMAEAEDNDETDYNSHGVESLLGVNTTTLASPEELIGGEVIGTDMEVHFIDVGQGDATLIKSGDSAILIDTAEGTMGTAIQNYLNKQGITRLDYLILTHPDADHIGGAPVIITKFAIDNVFMSNFEKDNRTYQKLLEALDYKRITPVTPAVGSTYVLGELSFTILAPMADYADPNNASIGLMVNHGEHSFLFTGDAEAEAEADILDSGNSVDANVYKVGHHGSNTSSSRAFLDAVSPEYAVISCGEDNSYGHPRAETLNNLRAMGVELFRTDEQGTLVVTSNGADLSWNSAASDSWQAGEPTRSSQQAAENTEADTESEGVTNDAPGSVRELPVITASEPEPEPAIGWYVLNVETKKFHLPSCGYLPTTNRQDTNMSREEVLAQGYDPCKRCDP